MANTHGANFVRASSQYASRSTSAKPNSQFTVEFWDRLTTTPGTADRYTVIAKGGSSGIEVFAVRFVGSSGGVVKIYAAVKNTSGAASENSWTVTPPIVNAGEPNHYAITFDLAEPTATEKFLYKNSVPVGYGDIITGSNVTSENWAGGTGFLSLGGGGGGGWYGNHDLDDVRIWNTIRSPSEIAFNYLRGLSAGDADFGDLWAYFRLDDGTGWTDSSATGLHLTPQNGPTFISPLFTEAGEPESRRLPHGIIPRPISDHDAVNRAFSRIEIQEAGVALYNPNNYNIWNFRSGVTIEEEVGVPGHINLDFSGGGTHATSHEENDTDELTVQNLGSGDGTPTGKMIESDGTGGWNLVDTPSGGGGTVATGIYERQVSAAIPEGDATLDEITTGVAAYPGSALALAVKVEDAVLTGTITVTLKVAGGATIVATLNSGVPSKVVATAAIGAHPIAFENEITIAIQTSGSYTNAATATTGMTIDVTLLNGEIGGSTQVTSTTVYGCPAGLAVNDAVYLSGADAVDLADADDAAKQPLIGFVRTKPTTTTCEVLYYGELSGFTGLTVGSNYFLSETPGEITTVAPTAPGSIVQKVGFPRNSTTLVVFVDRDYIEN